MVSFMSLPSGQWHSTRNVTRQKHSVSCYVAGNRVLVSYDGYSATFYGCNDAVRLYQACPSLQRLQETLPTSTSTSWVDIAARRTGIDTACQ